jgi:hypothetical protein
VSIDSKRVHVGNQTRAPNSLPVNLFKPHPLTDGKRAATIEHNQQRLGADFRRDRPPIAGAGFS